MSDLRTVSASSIADFKRAPRYWRLRYIDNVPVAQTGAQADGQAIHKEMEDWYLHGTEPKTPSCKLLLAEPTIPPRHSDILVEQPEDKNLGLVLAGVPVRGRIDLIVPPSVSATPVLQTIDWKSTGNLRYAKKPSELAVDAQNIIYTEYGFQRFPEAESATFTHGYILKSDAICAECDKARKNCACPQFVSLADCKVVTTDPVDRRVNRDLMDDLAATVEEMKKVAALPSWEDVPKCSDDPDSYSSPCRAYGGCPFRSRCWPVEDGASFFSVLGANASGPNVFVVDVEEVVDLSLKEPAAAPARVVVYVDVACEDETYPRLEPILEARAQAVLADFNQSSGRAYSDLGLIDFGKGTSALKASLRDNPITGGPYALSDRGLGSTALEILRAQGAKVYRPCR